MSAVRDLDIEIIYVPLLGEGTNVVRPAGATRCAVMTYEIARVESYDPDDEEWLFAPGSIVRRCEELHEGKKILVARELGHKLINGISNEREQ